MDNATPQSAVVVGQPVTPGAKIRNVQVLVNVVDAVTGVTSLQLVQMQAVQSWDENSNPIPFREEEDWRRDLLDEIRAIRLGIQELLEDSGCGYTVPALIDTARDQREDAETLAPA